MINTVEDLIELWPEPRVANFGRDLGIPVEHASAIKRRNSIPVRFWPKLLDSAREREIDGLNYDVLVGLHQKGAAA